MGTGQGNGIRAVPPPKKGKRPRPRIGDLRQIIGIEAQVPLTRFKKDAAQMAASLPRQEANLLCDLYYQIQEYRIRAQSQIAEAGEARKPHALMAWVYLMLEIIEQTIKVAMDRYSDESRVGVWAKGVHGIGEVLAGNMLAIFDITKVKHASSVYRFMGYDPDLKWLGKDGAKELVRRHVGKSSTVTDEQFTAICAEANRRPRNVRAQFRFKNPEMAAGTEPIKADALIKQMARRPWNHSAKVLGWKMATSFFMQRFNEKDFYGKLMEDRKAYEIRRNESGGNADYARKAIETKKLDKSKVAYEAYAEGRLPDGQIHKRALRWVAKLFISHWYEVAYEVQYGKPPPEPFAIARLKHTGRIYPPNWPDAEAKRRRAELGIE